MPSPAELSSWLERLAGAEYAADDAERVDLLAALEALKAGAAAAQVRVTVAFDASQRAAQAAAGMPVGKQGAGIAAQVALARRDSAHRGGRHLGLAKILHADLPRTLGLLAAGLISEHRALLLVRETVILAPAHRTAIDTALADQLPTLGDAGVVREARKLGYRLDPGSVLRRTRGAHADRRVTLRPAPDTMTYLTGFLPVASGVAVHATLTRHADSLRAAGDARSRGQIMADRLVELVTGQATPDSPPVEIGLVMTDRTLLGTSDTPGHLTGYGPIPAWLARDLARGPDDDSPAEQARVWIRRLFLSPDGRLAAQDSRRRTFTGQLRRFLIIRDQTCRTPWCDAPIRHLDHIDRAADGAPTTAEHGQGLCAACNYAKEAPGWRASPTRAGPRHTVVTTTPTGHTYASTAPDPPGFMGPAAPAPA